MLLCFNLYWFNLREIIILSYHLEFTQFPSREHIFSILYLLVTQVIMVNYTKNRWRLQRKMSTDALFSGFPLIPELRQLLVRKETFFMQKKVRTESRYSLSASVYSLQISWLTCRHSLTRILGLSSSSTCSLAWRPFLRPGLLGISSARSCSMDVDPDSRNGIVSTTYKLASLFNI